MQCSLFVAEQERQRSAIALEYEAKEAALKQVATLTLTLTLTLALTKVAALKQVAPLQAQP